MRSSRFWAMEVFSVAFALLGQAAGLLFSERGPYGPYELFAWPSGVATEGWTRGGVEDSTPPGIMLLSTWSFHLPWASSAIWISWMLVWH